MRADKLLAGLDKVVLGQTVLVAVLLAAQGLTQPEVGSGVPTPGGLPYRVPLAGFLVLIVSLAVGYLLALAGALRSPPRVRFPVLILVTGLLAIQPGNTVAGGTHRLAADRWLSLAQLAVLAAFWLWAAGPAVAERAATAGRAARPAAARRACRRHPAAGAVILLLAYYGLEFGIWLAFARAGRPAAGRGIVLYGIGAEVLLLPLFLVLPILAFSTDSVHHAQQVAGRILSSQRWQADRRLVFALPVLTAAVAAAVLGTEFMQAGKGLLAGLVAVIVLAGITALLVRLARVDARWRQEVPSGWLFLAAAFVFTDTVLLVDLNPFAPGLPSLVVNTAAALLPVPIALAALTVALFLIMKGREGKTNLGTGGLLLALVALVVLVRYYPVALADAGLRVPQPADLLGAVMICTAAGTLIWLLALLGRRPRGAWRQERTWRQQTQRLRSALLLLAGLLIVRVGYAVLQLDAHLGAESAVLLAAIFLWPALWKSLLPAARRTLAPVLSKYPPDHGRPTGAPDRDHPAQADGGPSPNGQASRGPADGPASRGPADVKTGSGPPRNAGQQLLQAGFTLTCNCLLLYLGTFREPVSGAVPPAFLTSDLTASLGLLLLGPAVVVVGFILRDRQRVRQAGGAPGGTPAAGRAAERPLRRRVVAGAAVASLLISASLFAIAFPRTVHASETRRYEASFSGPGCESAAYWTPTRHDPGTIACTQRELRMTVAAGSRGVVRFVPPSGVFTAGYRMSVRVGFARLARGCALIDTRVTAAGFYEASICNSGLWTVTRFTGTNLVLLASGLFARADSYAIAVTADGANERLSIDGVQVASVSDPRLSGTHRLALGISNLTKQPGLAVFSSFVFTPTSRPGQATTVARESYLAARPGPGCDHGAAQWAMMSAWLTRASCGPDGIAVATPAHAAGFLGFTPPAGIFPASYRVSVRVNLAGGTGQCMELGTRMVGGTGYRDTVCSNGEWLIQRINGPAGVTLAHGKVPPGRTHEIQAAADGADQSLTIDGARVGQVMNSSFKNTAFVQLAGVNIDRRPSLAVFSDFAFTPLA